MSAWVATNYAALGWTLSWDTLLLKLDQELFIVLDLVLDVFTTLGVLLAAKR